MGKTARKALILWLAAALSIMGFVAGFNVTVDPFGYFGRNSIGYYFSSERQFKYSIVKSYDYNAIMLGDSRIAFTDPAYIVLPKYRFLNGGIAGSSVPEQVALLSASRLDRLKLVVFGLHYGDLANCMDKVAPREFRSWEVLRFAASWTQFYYGIDALIAHAHGRNTRYHADGTRSIVATYFEESPLDEKTERYWRKIRSDIPKGADAEPHYEFGAKCRQVLGEARALADRHGFALLVVFLPRNSDLLALSKDTPKGREEAAKFLAEVGQVVPHVVDLSSSSFSDSGNFWLNDSMHFKPVIGAQIVEEAINRSLRAQASK